ncbi:hypothetical protein BGW41_004580 [Actinomortierella wolfii]|nr:hypothetical protein BGW41_004580 [Actinomortierella wolfii]
MAFKKLKAFFSKSQSSSSSRHVNQDSAPLPTSRSVNVADHPSRRRWQTFDRSEVLPHLPPLDFGISTPSSEGVGHPSSTTASSSSSVPTSNTMATTHRAPVSSSSYSLVGSHSVKTKQDTLTSKSLPIASKFKAVRQSLSLYIPLSNSRRQQDNPLPSRPGSSKSKGKNKMNTSQKKECLVSVCLYPSDDDDDDDGGEASDDSLTLPPAGYHMGYHRTMQPQRATSVQSASSMPMQRSANTLQNLRPSYSSHTIPKRISSSDHRSTTQSMRPEDIALIQSIRIPYDDHRSQSLYFEPDQLPHVDHQSLMSSYTLPRTRHSCPGPSDYAAAAAAAAAARVGGAMSPSSWLDPPQAVEETCEQQGLLLYPGVASTTTRHGMRLSSTASSPTLGQPDPRMRVHPQDLIESASMPNLVLPPSRAMATGEGPLLLSANDAATCCCMSCARASNFAPIAAEQESRSRFMALPNGVSPALVIAHANAAATATVVPIPAATASTTTATTAGNSWSSVGLQSSTLNRSSRHSAHRIIYQDDLDNHRVHLPLHGDYAIVPGASEDGPLAGDNYGETTAYLAHEAQRNRVVIRPDFDAGRASVLPAVAASPQYRSVILEHADPRPVSLPPLLPSSSLSLPSMMMMTPNASTTAQTTAGVLQLPSQPPPLLPRTHSVSNFTNAPSLKAAAGQGGLLPPSSSKRKRQDRDGYTQCRLFQSDEKSSSSLWSQASLLQAFQPSSIAPLPHRHLLICSPTLPHPPRTTIPSSSTVQMSSIVPSIDIDPGSPEPRSSCESTGHHPGCPSPAHPSVMGKPKLHQPTRPSTAFTKTLLAKLTRVANRRHEKSRATPSIHSLLSSSSSSPSPSLPSSENFVSTSVHGTDSASRSTLLSLSSQKLPTGRPRQRITGSLNMGMSKKQWQQLWVALGRSPPRDASCNHGTTCYDAGGSTQLQDQGGHGKTDRQPISAAAKTVRNSARYRDKKPAHLSVVTTPYYHAGRTAVTHEPPHVNPAFTTTTSTATMDCPSASAMPSTMNEKEGGKEIITSSAQQSGLNSNHTIVTHMLEPLLSQDIAADASSTTAEAYILSDNVLTDNVIHELEVYSGSGSSPGTSVSGSSLPIALLSAHEDQRVNSNSPRSNSDESPSSSSLVQTPFSGDARLRSPLRLSTLQRFNKYVYRLLGITSKKSRARRLQPNNSAQEMLMALVNADNEARQSLGFPIPIHTRRSKESASLSDSSTASTSSDINRNSDNGSDSDGTDDFDTNLRIYIALKLCENEPGPPDLNWNWDWMLRLLAQGQQCDGAGEQLARQLVDDTHFVGKKLCMEQDEQLSCTVNGRLLSGNDADHQALDRVTHAEKPTPYCPSDTIWLKDQGDVKEQTDEKVVESDEPTLPSWPDQGVKELQDMHLEQALSISSSSIFSLSPISMHCAALQPLEDDCSRGSTSVPVKPEDEMGPLDLSPLLSSPSPSEEDEAELPVQRLDKGKGRADCNPLPPPLSLPPSCRSPATVSSSVSAADTENSLRIQVEMAPHPSLHSVDTQPCRAHRYQHRPPDRRHLRRLQGRPRRRHLQRVPELTYVPVLSPVIECVKERPASKPLLDEDRHQPHIIPSFGSPVYIPHGRHYGHGYNHHHHCHYHCHHCCSSSNGEKCEMGSYEGSMPLGWQRRQKAVNLLFASPDQLKYASAIPEFNHPSIAVRSLCDVDSWRDGLTVQPNKTARELAHLQELYALQEIWEQLQQNTAEIQHLQELIQQQQEQQENRVKEEQWRQHHHQQKQKRRHRLQREKLAQLQEHRRQQREGSPSTSWSLAAVMEDSEGALSPYSTHLNADYAGNDLDSGVQLGSACSFADSCSTIPQSLAHIQARSLINGKPIQEIVVDIRGSHTETMIFDEGPNEPYAQNDRQRQAIRLAHEDRLAAEQREIRAKQRQLKPLLARERRLRLQQQAESEQKAKAMARAEKEKKKKQMPSINFYEQPQQTSPRRVHGLEQQRRQGSYREGEEELQKGGHAYQHHRHYHQQRYGSDDQESVASLSVYHRLMHTVTQGTRQALRRSMSIFPRRQDRCTVEKIKRDAASATASTHVERDGKLSSMEIIRYLEE